MPRPKRSKVAPSAPTALPNKFKSNAKSALPSHVSSPKSTTTTTNSDDSEGLVTRKRIGKTTKGVASQDVQMSGALAISSDGSTTRRKPMRGAKKATLSRAARAAPVPPQVRDSQEENAQHDIDATEVQVPASLPESTGLDVEESAAGEEHEQVQGQSSPETPRSSQRENVFASAIKRPQSRTGFNWRTQATPQADSSMISLAKFKRRPRQPSILGIGRPDDSPSLDSLGGLSNDDTLGTGGEHSKLAGFDVTIYDQLSDFEPDNESTPFGASKLPQVPATQSENEEVSSRSSTPSSPPVYVSSRRNVQERSSPGSAFEAQLDIPLLSKSTAISPVQSRKRKITPPKDTVPQSQVGLEPAHSQEAETGVQSDSERSSHHSNENQEDWELPSPKRTSVAHEAQPEPDRWSETMAPPRSSSPDGSQSQATKPVCSPKATAMRGRGRGRPKRKLQPPAATAASTRSKAKKEPHKPVSTATLQALLPRRRTRKQAGEFDILSDSPEPSEVDEEQDELSYIGPGRKANRKASGTKTRRAAVTKSKTPKPQKQSRATAPTAASTAKAKSRVSSKNPPSAQPKRTYSRRVSDKENQPVEISSGAGNESNDSLMPDGNEYVELGADTSNTSIELPPDAQREMRKVAQKFKEVDDWKMEFEDITASSSSPKDAR